MKKLFLSFVFCILTGVLYAQGFIQTSDNYFIYSATNSYVFGTGVGSKIDLQFYGLNPNQDVALLDLEVLDVDYGYENIIYLEGYINVYEGDDIISSDFDSFYGVTYGSPMHLSVNVPSSATKIVFYYWINLDELGGYGVEDRQIVYEK